MHLIDQLFFFLSLRGFIKSRKDLHHSPIIWKNKNNISYDDALRLDILSDLSTSRDPRNRYQSNKMSCKDVIALQQSLKNLFLFKTINVFLEIQGITGICASRSDIKNRISMEDFVEQDCREFFEIDAEHFQKNLNHTDINIIHDPNTLDHFFLCGWNPTLYLVNGKGGSHHFASMRYIAAKLNILFYLTGSLKLIYLNELAVSKFNHQYKAYLLSPNDQSKIQKIVDLYNLPCLFFFNSKFLPQNSCLLFFKKVDWKLFSFQEKTLNTVLTSFNNELETHLTNQQKNILFQKFIKNQTNSGD
ncbi:hypothetical protein QLG01_13165 [Acinetobacter sp. V89_4]|uniref:DUF6685 family protein n=1 Tax=Acinetobacter sp. V89_4 TaxID=3044232 RepID=UPI00249ED44E|nr:DUF6685 family protein [Acinetobacter sp. V89_4]MDI3454142.1 hypothetical protein [Acinetobacter sp. V89_4]